MDKNVPANINALIVIKITFTITTKYYNLKYPKYFMAI